MCAPCRADVVSLDRAKGKEEKRKVLSKQVGLKGKSKGQQAYLASKDKGDHSMLVKQRMQRRCRKHRSARPAWHGKSYTARSPIPEGPVGTYRKGTRNRYPLCIEISTGSMQPLERSAIGNEPIQGMSGLPTPRYHVSHEQNTGLPTGRESYGNGVPIVV